jgi:hypothetical protein
MDRRDFGRVVHGKVTGRHTSAQVSAFKQVVPVRRLGYHFPNQYQFRSLERWDRAFESHARPECLCAFIVLFLLCVCMYVCMYVRTYVYGVGHKIPSLHRDLQ